MEVEKEKEDFYLFFKMLIFTLAKTEMHIIKLVTLVFFGQNVHWD